MIFVYVWSCVADGGNCGRGKCPESVGWVMELSVRRTQGVVVVCCRLFKIMVSLSRMCYPVAPVSVLRVIILVELMSNA